MKKLSPAAIARLRPSWAAPDQKPYRVLSNGQGLYVPPQTSSISRSPIGRKAPPLDYSDGKRPSAMVAQLAELNPRWLDDPRCFASVAAVLFSAIAVFVVAVEAFKP